MTRPTLILVLLLTLCFGMAAHLQPRQAEWEQGSRSGSLLKIMLGDGRRLFANHFFAKADEYFHKGKYPSIFDERSENEELHMAQEGHEENVEEKLDGDEDDHEGHDHDEHAEEGRRLGTKTVSWIERFGSQFAPSQHVHLGEGEEREMLPWLRLSAELDPQKIETYIVAAYWLRTKLDKIDEAERFLRDGLKANPRSPAILYELGRLQFEHRRDLDRARNLWTAALDFWKETERDNEEPDLLLYSQIVGGLALLEREAGNIYEAVGYLELLREASPNRAAIENLIRQIRSSQDQ